MATDMEIMRKAMDREKTFQAPKFGIDGSWEYFTVGASRGDIERLKDEGLCEPVHRSGNIVKYKLTKAGRDLVWAANMDNEMTKIPAETLLEAMSLIIGYDDIKDELAHAIERRLKVNYLLVGPPACAKSLFLEAVRSCVPRAQIAFGSRTSGAGLSDLLFEHHPEILLLDEADKMRHDVFSLMLGLMESGEIIETKSGKTRDVKLKTMVIAACNDSSNMPREFKSRFGQIWEFPEYTREEFINVCVGLLTRAENAPPDVARMIGELVYDNGLGDVRKARSTKIQMRNDSPGEALRIINMTLKYAPKGEVYSKKIKIGPQRLL